MAVDPLSAATRSAKRNLLIVSVMALTFRAFDISVDKIPVGGLTITYDPGVFAFLLAVALAYFFVTFLLYYYIDIRNFEETEHEKAIAKMSFGRTHGFPQRYAAQLTEAVNAKIAPHFKFIPGPELERLLDNIYKARRKEAEKLAEEYSGAIALSKLDHGGGRWVRDERESTEKTSSMALVRPIIHRMLLSYRWRRPMNKFRFDRIRWRVRMTYRLRNYVTDGALPIAVGILAFGALYGWFDVHWLRNIAPSR